MENSSMPRYRITVSGKDREAMLDLARKHKIQVFDHGIHYDDTVGYSVGALAEPADIQALEKAGYQIRRHEDVDKQGKERQQEVGEGDRYKRPPRS
jgi:hypothetical protein